MAYALVVYPARRLACFRFFGEVSVSEAAQAFLDYVAHPEFDPGFRMLSDARQVTRIDASFLRIFSKVASLITVLRKFQAGATSVIIVGDETTFGYVRMLEQVLDHASAIKLQATWTEDEALRLAGLPEGRLADLWPSATPAP